MLADGLVRVIAPSDVFATERYPTWVPGSGETIDKDRWSGPVLLGHTMILHQVGLLV